MKSLVNHVLVVLVSLLAVVAALYATEFYLVASTQSQAPGAAEGSRDTRDRLQVVLDLRAEGAAAYPAIFPRALLQTKADGKLHSRIRIDGEELLPLGGVSRRTTVTCNESGQFAIYQSDEHGFNNPLGLWDAAPVDLVAIGDSFTYGNCVPANKTIVAHLRDRYRSAVNLGLGGIGPLAGLAVLREYGPTLRPKLVLWFFYEGNDMGELDQEARSDLLMGQLAGQPAQGLAPRQADIDKALMAFADARVAEHEDRPSSFGRFLRLSTLRERLRAMTTAGGEAGAAPGPANFALLRRVFAVALQTSGEWGGRVVLVYLPGRDRYFGDSSRSAPSESIHRGVLDVVGALGIPTIDIVPVLEATGAPGELFVDPNSHLNERGYALVARAVISGLEGTR